MKTEYDTNILRSIFNALPSMVFIVDEDVQIYEYNEAAANLLRSERNTILKHRAGDILHCIHSTDTPEGCGRASFCENCIIRNSVREAYKGKHIVRRRIRMELISKKNTTEIYALITASPFIFQEKTMVLLVIEDISEIAELTRIIPICSICKKVRNDKESWMRVETYFKEHWDMDFSHGLCPDCYKIESEKLK